MYLQYMCILLYVKLVFCNGVPYTFVNWSCGGYMYPQYMRILLHVKLMLCNGMHRSIVKWSGGTCILSICAFCYM